MITLHQRFIVFYFNNISVHDFDHSKATGPSAVTDIILQKSAFKQLIIFYAQSIRNVVQRFSREGVPVPAEPPPWKSGPLPKKTAVSGGKTKKKLPTFFLRLWDTYKKYILQKNWVKTAIPALSSGQTNLHPPNMGSQPPTR